MALNWIGIAVATVAGMAVGAIWYSNVLLGRPWRRLTGVPASGPARPVVAYTCALVSTFVTATLIAVAVLLVTTATALDAVPAALVSAGALWLGVAAARSAINTAFEGTSVRLLLIDTGHDLAVLVVLAAIIGLVAPATGL